jgi:hypothetical protein
MFLSALNLKILKHVRVYGKQVDLYVLVKRILALSTIIKSHFMDSRLLRTN